MPTNHKFFHLFDEKIHILFVLLTVIKIIDWGYSGNTSEIFLASYDYLFSMNWAETNFQVKNRHPFWIAPSVSRLFLADSEAISFYYTLNYRQMSILGSVYIQVLIVQQLLPKKNIVNKIKNLQKSIKG